MIERGFLGYSLVTWKEHIKTVLNVAAPNILTYVIQLCIPVCTLEHYTSYYLSVGLSFYLRIRCVSVSW